ADLARVVEKGIMAAIVGIMVNRACVNVVENGIVVDTTRIFDATLFKVVEVGIVIAMPLTFDASLSRVVDVGIVSVMVLRLNATLEGTTLISGILILIARNFSRWKVVV